jgi:hypothetical protein
LAKITIKKMYFNMSWKIENPCTFDAKYPDQMELMGHKSDPRIRIRREKALIKMVEFSLI